jgi:drug/metabolite transporter (DMT)-like permease
LAAQTLIKKYAMNSRNSIFIYVPVITAMALWSFSFIWYKQVFLYFEPVTVAVLRLIIAVPLLFVISVLVKKLQRIQRSHLSWFLLLGFFEPFLYFLGECYGVNMISPTLASIIISLIPLLAPIPARFLFREQFSFSNYIGLIISVVGVLLVITGESSSKPAPVAGVLLMLLAVISAVCHAVYVRKLSEHYNSFTIVTYQSTFGLLYFIPLFMVLEFNHFYHMHHSFDMFIPLIKLAVFASTIAFLLFVYSIQRIGMAKTNVFVNLIPVFTAALSFFLLGEQFGITKNIGIVIVIAGLIFSQFNYAVRIANRTVK